MRISYSIARHVHGGDDVKELIHDSDYMDMELGFAYRFLNENSLLTSAHTHNYYEYFLVTEGHVLHRVNGQKEKLSRGDLVLIRPSDYHSYELNGKSPFNMINVSFCVHHFFAACQYLGKNMERQFLSPLYPPTVNILPFADCTLEADHNFLNFYVGDNNELYVRLRYLLVETLVTFVRFAKLQQGQDYDIWLRRALDQMTTPENLEEGVPALLRLTGFSHGHLCRLMKQQTGVTPNQYVTRLRMTYAANLLANSDNSILDISLKSGYSSLSHFITVFKKYHGSLPHVYRQLHANNKANWK